MGDPTAVSTRKERYGAKVHRARRGAFVSLRAWLRNHLLSRIVGNTSGAQATTATAPLVRGSMIMEGMRMPHSDLWGALSFIREPGGKPAETYILRADEPLREYIPGIGDGEVVTGTEIRFLKYLTENACIVELKGRELMLTKREARKIFVGWED
jgi:hypothetical protein